MLMMNLTGSMITQLQLVDDMPVSYRLISGGPQFSIDLRGKVTLTGPLDREDIAAHSLAVLALTESSPPLTALTEISLQVLDSNDNAPIFDSDTYSVGVPENVVEGTSVFKGEYTISLKKYNLFLSRANKLGELKPFHHTPSKNFMPLCKEPCKI